MSVIPALLQSLILFLSIATTVPAVQISAGTSTLSGTNDKCSDIQEFSCINDICDQQAGSGSTSGGECRNGDASSTPCDAGAFCGKPTAGHCLENTISETGLHAMPNKSQGTPKHFYCVSVTSFDKPVVLWENDDCTGQSCFVPSTGQFTTWSRGAQGNCVEIDPVTPVNTTACISAGQKSTFPPNGGFPSSVPEPVGGDYGLPAAWDNSNECNALLGSSTPASIPTNDTLPPAIDASERYQSNITANQGFGINDLYRRDGLLAKRANPVTQALRDGTPFLSQDRTVVFISLPKDTDNGTNFIAYNYRSAYIAARSTWLVITSSGTLRSWTGSVVRNHLSVDHIVELDMIVTFFTGGVGRGAGLSQNQWTLLANFITSRGIQAMTGQRVGRKIKLFEGFFNEAITQITLFANKHANDSVLSTLNLRPMLEALVICAASISALIN